MKGFLYHLLFFVGSVCALLCSGCGNISQNPVHPDLASGGRWKTVFDSIQKGDFAMAATTAVDELEGIYPDRKYALWKWWEYTFGERSNYSAISDSFGSALFAEYDHSPPSRRKIIAEIFEAPGFDLSKTGSELRKSVDSN